MFRSEEQRRFYQIVAKHIKEQDGPLLLEGGTGLGKTRAYLAAISEAKGRIAVVLPTHQLIDQLIISSDLESIGLSVTAFRRAGFFDTRAEYLEHRDTAMNGRVMICTAASVMIDQRLDGAYNGASERDYLIFDEADQLPSAAALQRDLMVTKAETQDAGILFIDMVETLQSLIGKKEIDAEVKARAKIISEALSSPAWYQKVGVNDDGDIELVHRLPGRLLSKIANKGNVAFISATLQVGRSFNDFKRSMGIKGESRLSGSIEPENHGSITVTAELEADVIDVIKGAAKPCLVVTTSFDDAESISSSLPDAIIRKRDETTSEAAARVTGDGILIAAGAWAGLDTPIRWASIVVPKIPFEKPTVLEKKIESSYIDSRNVATRRMRQVVGRGLRSPDAVCEIYILDSRYKKIGEFLPDRFRESWREGELGEYLAKERTRNRAYRAKVFQEYGLKCVACDHEPPTQSILDVHHLDPIAEGVRNTTLKDLVPLCPTCHRYAHQENPPMSMERLRKIRTELV